MNFTWICKRQKGFTLLEIMVAAAILTAGLVPIFKSFLTAVDAFNLYSNTIHSQLLIDEKISDMHEQVLRGQNLVFQDPSGSIKNAQREYEWKASHSLIDAQKGLYLISITCAWSVGQNQRQASRVAYALGLLEIEESENASSP